MGKSNLFSIRSQSTAAEVSSMNSISRVAARDPMQRKCAGMQRVTSAEGSLPKNLEIKENEFVAIVGSSGSGKTTLLNLIGGLDSPTSGKIIYFGHDISKLDEDEKTLFRRRVGYIFQDFNLHPVLTSMQNVELPMIYAEEFSKEERNDRCQLLLRQVGLEKRLHHIPAELSSGEKQRVGIARALANKPRLILADQPTGNTSPRV